MNNTMNDTINVTMNVFKPPQTNTKNQIEPANTHEILCISTDIVLSSACKELSKEFSFDLPYYILQDCSIPVECKPVPGTEQTLFVDLQPTSTPGIYNCYAVVSQEYTFTIHCYSGNKQCTKELIFPILCTLSLSEQGSFDIQVKLTPSICNSFIEKGDSSVYQVTGTEQGEQFSFAVDYNNNPSTIWVGSPSATFGVIQDAGKITALTHPMGVELFHKFGSASDDEFAYALDAGYDLNGDGWNDILTGAPSAKVGTALRAGYIRVLSGFNGSTLLEIKNTVAETQFGWAVSWAGDLNGDSVPDLLVGAPQASPGAVINAGSVFVYSGASGTLLYRLDGANTDDSFGYTVKTIGDVDGDGIPDFAIGAPFASPGGLNQAGIVYVYSGVSGTLLYTIQGTEINAQLGFSLGTISDINGDSIPDILVGAPGSSPGGRNEAGAAYIFSGANGSQLFHFTGPISGEEVGTSVASIDNIYSGCLPNLILGAPSASPNNQRFAGKVYLVSINSGNILNVFEGEATWAQFGWSTAGTEQLNSKTILIGSPGTDTLYIYQFGPPKNKLYCVINGAAVITVTKKADILIPTYSNTHPPICK